MVDILNAVLTDGLPAVEAACAEAVGQGVHSADVALNILARQREGSAYRTRSSRHHLRRLRQRLPNQIVTVVGDEGAVCVLNFPH
jgi:hypothetical protein